MPRYFLEVAYNGTAYSGFQSQHNANTIQAEAEKALEILVREKISLTGSSRTDAGVHARQNFFHFDIASGDKWEAIRSNGNFLYNINAILPPDIVLKNLFAVDDSAHCRFDAVSREYRYMIYFNKDPFLQGRAYYFPFTVDKEILKEAARIVFDYTDFSSFSKRHTQVKNFNCQILESRWMQKNNLLIYHVKANRFLRGMVKALVATMLRAGRKKISLEEFRAIIESRDCSMASFAVPSTGLYLMRVDYPAFARDASRFFKRSAKVRASVFLPKYLFHNF